MDIAEKQIVIWPRWRKVVFRFLFIYFTLTITPWAWFDAVPFLPKYYNQLWAWLVKFGNDHLFHITKVLVYPNGSGDTSYNWAEISLILTLSLAGCIIWSAADRGRKNYERLNYWLCVFTRYYLIMTALVYGIIKLYALQMEFPNLHQLATPLGDYLPMRLSWQFIGYSTPYQVFSGAMEVVAALLLLYRRTITLGLVTALAVFTNVMMLNLCYDIPVKIFSMQLVFICLFLLASDGKRLFDFFILNKPTPAADNYNFPYRKKYMRIVRVVLKVIFIGYALCMQIYSSYKEYLDEHPAQTKSLIKNGLYDVTSFKLNNKLPALFTADSLAWQDVILENGTGSIKTGDSLFKMRYSRGYFDYFIDTLNRRMDFKREYKGSVYTILSLHFELPDSNTIKLSGKRGEDSLKVELKRSKHHFQLAERQFHWLSEHNR
ncbi:hypothetical protein ACFS5N_18770 [Mucilaginibacter ximonensis]|uniref:DoxX family protein n=1 Tax=Mucilaginibacter ximonensis TaxID=538021 RepID=A0ABW5YHL4_9SPHI